MSICGEGIDYLPCPLPLGWEGVSLPGGLETTVSAPPHASADAAQACRVSTASGAGTQRASLLPGTTVCTDLACAPVLAGSHHSAPLPAGVGNNTLAGKLHLASCLDGVPRHRD